LIRSAVEVHRLVVCHSEHFGLPAVRGGSRRNGFCLSAGANRCLGETASPGSGSSRRNIAGGITSSLLICDGKNLSAVSLRRTR
jgi:hypothetical protein